MKSVLPEDKLMWSWWNAYELLFLECKSLCFLLDVAKPSKPTGDRTFRSRWNGEGKEEWIDSQKDALSLCHLTNLWGSEMWTLDQNERCLLAVPLPAWKAAWFLSCTVSTRRRTDHNQQQSVHLPHLQIGYAALCRVSSLTSVPSLQECQKRITYP